ncbi:hypothetical protein B14911_00065 [Bacillus sp. NRRL B-14911]|nr:hypothetical protein B14911_00065 [Bacillus sp. NRRL B-14911]
MSFAGEYNFFAEVKAKTNLFFRIFLLKFQTNSLGGTNLEKA